MDHGLCAPGLQLSSMLSGIGMQADLDINALIQMDLLHSTKSFT